MSEKDAQPSVPGPGVGGRLSREAALSLLERGNELLASGDFAEAGGHFSRVVGFDDPAITAAALLGLGEAHYRLNNEPAAVQSWQAVLQLPETPSTYPAWRNVAAARVRDGDLTGAIQAYRQADKLAPREDKAEIANRLGWLNKETGDARASKRYFAKGRGDRGRLTMTLVIIAVTTIVSLTVMFSSEGDAIIAQLWFSKAGIVAGEYWRLWTVTLVHDPSDPLHLIFNMFALYVAGTIVERWYGSLRFLAIYLACAAAGSTASLVFGSGGPSIGASGAIMGLFGVLLAAGRIHHPVDREARAMASRLVIFIVITLGFGFISGGAVDNAAHVGGLVAGLWLGALVPPSNVPTLSSLWRQPDGSRSAAGRAAAPGYVLALGIAVVGVVVVAGVAIGTSGRNVVPDPTQVGGRAGDVVALAQSVGGSAVVSSRSTSESTVPVSIGGGSGPATAASTER
jgi:membrane associated rhomboid family serine protease